MISIKKAERWMRTPHKPICRNGATTDDTSLLLAKCQELGMKRSTFYNRANYIGFNQWEMFGIENCLRAYINNYNRSCKGNDNMQTIELPSSNTRLNLISLRYALGNAHRLKDFYRYMDSLGMSYKTTLNRFRSLNFSEWELLGFYSITISCTNN